MNARDPIDELIDGCLNGLDSNLQPDPPSLWDPHSKQPTPASHYAHCSLALALFLRRPGSPRWKTALAAYLTIPPQALGHHPFNRLLLLILDSALNPGAHGERELVRLALRRCPLSNDYPSNNWTLLAQLDRILEAPANSSARHDATASFERLLTRWMTSAGGFIDFPSHPSERKFATPIAYHHKALFLTTVAVIHGECHSLTPRLQALLDWAVQWIDAGGLCGGYGRTNHGLFGDACLLASLAILDRSGACAEVLLRGAMSRIVSRLQRQQRPDGLIWLTPAGAAGWDDYMHLTVYDAWFVATVGWANVVKPASKAIEIRWNEPSEGLFVDESAGLVSWRIRGRSGLLEAMISTTGQPPQGFSASHAELRYAAATVFHLAVNGSPRIPPPVRLDVSALRQQPPLAGKVPLFEYNNHLYGFVAASVQFLEEKDRKLIIQLAGCPVALSAVPDRNGLLARLVDAIDWRLLGGRLARQRNLVRPHLEQLRCTLQLSVSVDPPHLTSTLHIDTSLIGSVDFLNPSVTALVGHRPQTDSTQPYPSSLPDSWCHSDPRVSLSAPRTTIETHLPLDRVPVEPKGVIG